MFTGGDQPSLQGSLAALQKKVLRQNPSMRALNSEDDPNLISGQLFKRSSAFHTWKTRSCYLHYHRFQFYNLKGILKRDYDFSDQKHGRICIKVCIGCTPFGFCLSFKDEKLIFCAKNEKDQKRWIDGFVTHCDAQIDQAFVALATDKTGVRLGLLRLGDHHQAMPTFDEDAHKEQHERHMMAARDNITHADGGFDDATVFDQDKYQFDYGPLKETYSKITFPSALANGDVLVGIGPMVRRVNFTEERILSVAFYIEVVEAQAHFNQPQHQQYQNQTSEQLFRDQTFYFNLIKSSFRKTFVISCRKRTSKSMVLAILIDELSIRIPYHPVLEEIRGFIEKSLKKGQSMVMTCNADNTIFQFRYCGETYPPISSSELCQAVQGIFFDLDSIQQEAKRGLIDRLPSILFESFSYNKLSSSPSLELEQSEPQHRLRSNSLESQDNDEYAEEILDKMEEQEQEYRRQESCSFVARVGAIIDMDSGIHFPGYLSDSEALIGTWTRPSTPEFSNASEVPASEKHVEYTVGLYVDANNMCEYLLRYKGLSLGSLFLDPQFFSDFISSLFYKTLVIVFTESTNVDQFIQSLSTDLVHRTNISSSDKQDLERMKSVLGNLTPNASFSSKDEIHFGILNNGQVRVWLLHRVSNQYYPQEIPSLPLSHHFALALQNIYFGYNPLALTGRTHLFQRIPQILDEAKDDLVHTYLDEIKMLKENYNRQAPGTKVKVGYLLLQNPLIKGRLPKKDWSKRWCRLDGHHFSYFNYKLKRKPRAILDLLHCAVQDISSCISPLESSNPVITIAITDEGGNELILLRTESIYEGESWIEALSGACESTTLQQQQMPKTPHKGLRKGSRSRSSTHQSTLKDRSESPILTSLEKRKSMRSKRSLSHSPSPLPRTTPGRTKMPEEERAQRRMTLWRWIQEDPKHLVILGLSAALVWLISKQDGVYAASPENRYCMAP